MSSVGRGVLLCAATLAAAAAAAKEDAGEPDYLSMSLEELLRVEVGPASLLPTSAIEASSTLDTVPRSEWQQRGARRLLDTVSNLPATLVLPMHLGAEALAIRGYGSVNSYSGAALLWDGVPLNDLFLDSGLVALSNINPGVLDRVDLIRGPGSALYGSDAFHGVLALHGFESGKDMAEAGVEGGGNEYYDAWGRASTGVFDGARLNVAIDTAAQGNQDRDYHYTDPYTGTPQRGERAHSYGASSASLKLVSGADSPWSYTAGIYAHRFSADGFSGVGTALAGTRDFSDMDTGFDMAQIGVGRTLAGEQRLDAQVYAWRSDIDAHTGLVFPIVGRQEVPREQQRSGAKLVYTAPPLGANTRLALAAGADRLEVEEARLRRVAVDGTLLTDIEHPAGDTERTIRFLTLEANTRWADGRWVLSYGARADDYSDIGSHVSPRLGLVYRPAPDTAWKLIYANAFRAPSAFELNGAAGAVAGNQQLDPEVLDSYELVYLKQWQQRLVQVELFGSRWSDAITVTTNPAGPQPFRYQNGGDSESWGASFALRQELGAFTLDGNVSYTHGETRDTHEHYGMFPRWMLKLGAGWTPAPATRLRLEQLVYVELDDVLPVEAGFPVIELDTYWRTDLVASRVIADGFELFATVRNLFDRSNALPSPLGSRGGIPDEERSASLGVRVAF